MQTYKYDIFISFSTKDKEIARQIVDKLQAAGIKTWCSSDQFREQPSSVDSAINHGIPNSEYGLAIISPNYLKSDWCAKEWAAMSSTESKLREKKTLLCVWHNITEKEILVQKPLWADRFAFKTEHGLDHVVGRFVETNEQEAFSFSQFD